jgi:hypothetical protein
MNGYESSIFMIKIHEDMLLYSIKYVYRFKDAVFNVQIFIICMF